MQNMKITCTKEDLIHASVSIQKAIAVKTTLPVLTGIYFCATDNKLEMQATDYEVGISCTIPAQVEKPGTIVLSGKYFQDMVRHLPGDSVQISSEEEDRTIRITAGASQFNLLSMPAEEFPYFTPFTTDKTVIIQDNILRELIRKTVFACAVEDTRPIFTGALLETDGSGQCIRMVATNTHRLALRKMNHQSEADEQLKMIISSKILNELSKIMANDHPQDVKITWQRGKVGFQFDDIYLKTCPIDGQFPDYNRVIPPTFETSAIIVTDELKDAVERVSLLARDGEYNVIKFIFSEKQLMISSNNPDIGKAFETLPIELTGKEIEIAFNARYISDILKIIDAPKIVFSLNTPLSAASIRQHNDEDYIYIITPVRTK